MNAEEMKLPEMEKSVFGSNVFLRKEWVMDPPSWIVSRLRDDLIVNIYRIKMNHLAELAKLEAHIKEIESKMFSEIAASIAQGK
jgi:hypothetical protein